MGGKEYMEWKNSVHAHMKTVLWPPFHKLLYPLQANGITKLVHFIIEALTLYYCSVYQCSCIRVSA